MGGLRIPLRSDSALAFAVDLAGSNPMTETWTVGVGHITIGRDGTFTVSRAIFDKWRPMAWPALKALAVGRVLRADNDALVIGDREVDDGTIGE